MLTSKSSPYIQFYEMSIDTQNTFLLKYKHLIVDNRSANIITGFLNNEIIFVVGANETLELFDLFTDENVPVAAGVKIRLTQNVAGSVVRVTNFGV